MSEDKETQTMLDNLQKELKDIDKARKTINKTQNPALKGMLSRLETREKQIKNHTQYLSQKLNGPWMDSSGWIQRGKYEGLYIIPLLKAMADSAWDFPSAMSTIGKSVEDPHMVKEIDFKMHPDDYPKNHDCYGYLMEMAPDARWDQMLEDTIQWDT